VAFITLTSSSEQKMVGIPVGEVEAGTYKKRKLSSIHVIPGSFIRDLGHPPARLSARKMALE
jgi:hypothetical protein